jgi:hypothetical protein
MNRVVPLNQRVPPPFNKAGNAIIKGRKCYKTGKKLKWKSNAERIPGKNNCNDKPEKTYKTTNNKDCFSTILIHWKTQ